MRIFLTGGTGFIGSHFIRHALHSGHKVIAMRRPGSVARINLTNQPDWHNGQMTDDFSKALKVCDAFVHLAANGVANGASDWEGCFAINLHQSLQLWLQAVAAGIRRFLIVGSCFEYGRSGERYEAIPVTAPLEPTSAYGASKAAATVAAHALAIEKQLSLVVARPFHIYGEGEDKSRFWPSLVTAAQQGKNLQMTAGEQIRDFQPVEQAVMQLLALLVGEYSPYGEPKLVNLGTGHHMTLRAFAEREWTYLKAKGAIITGSVPYRINEVMRYVPEVTYFTQNGPNQANGVHE